MESSELHDSNVCLPFLANSLKERCGGISSEYRSSFNQGVQIQRHRGSARANLASQRGAGVVRLEDVRPMWLCASPNERYLLLEDPETGDILMPLIYLKSIFENNYSRKLSSLKNRVVIKPELVTQDTDVLSCGPLYWTTAFESPQDVKMLVKKELGEDNTPQGHLRLILLPIVYNAMSQNSNMTSMNLFKALSRCMSKSTYYPLLKHPHGSFAADRETEGLQHEEEEELLFHGPRNLAETASKYMFQDRESEEADITSIKRGRYRQGSSDALYGSQDLSDFYPSSPKDADSESERVAKLEMEVQSLRLEVQSLRLEGERSAAMNSITCNEIRVVKSCLIQLYNEILPTGRLHHHNVTAAQLRVSQMEHEVGPTSPLPQGQTQVPVSSGGRCATINLQAQVPVPPTPFSQPVAMSAGWGDHPMEQASGLGRRSRSTSKIPEYSECMSVSDNRLGALHCHEDAMSLPNGSSSPAHHAGGFSSQMSRMNVDECPQEIAAHSVGDYNSTGIPGRHYLPSMPSLSDGFPYPQAVSHPMAHQLAYCGSANGGSGGVPMHQSLNTHLRAAQGGAFLPNSMSHQQQHVAQYLQHSASCPH